MTYNLLITDSLVYVHYLQNYMHIFQNEVNALHLDLLSNINTIYIHQYEHESSNKC